MILKGEFGFLGLKNNKIEANRPTYDDFELDQADNGLYTFKGQHYSESNRDKCAYCHTSVKEGSFGFVNYI